MELAARVLLVDRSAAAPEIKGSAFLLVILTPDAPIGVVLTEIPKIFGAGPTAEETPTRPDKNRRHKTMVVEGPRCRKVGRAA